MQPISSYSILTSSVCTYVDHEQYESPRNLTLLSEKAYFPKCQASPGTKAVLLVTNVFQLLSFFFFFLTWSLFFPLQREAAFKDHSPLGTETLLKWKNHCSQCGVAIKAKKQQKKITRSDWKRKKTPSEIKTVIPLQERKSQQQSVPAVVLREPVPR